MAAALALRPALPASVAFVVFGAVDALAADFVVASGHENFRASVADNDNDEYLFPQATSALRSLHLPLFPTT
jgi:hypothetical protein